MLDTIIESARKVVGVPARTDGTPDRRPRASIALGLSAGRPSQLFFVAFVALLLADDAALSLHTTTKNYIYTYILCIYIYIYI